MRDIGPVNVAAQLFGVLADLADGQEARPLDVPFLDDADVVTFTEDGGFSDYATGVVVRTAAGLTFHITVTIAD
jgi:hypothetical protein